MGTLGFPVGSDDKELPTMQETRVWSLGWKDALEIFPGEKNGNPLQDSFLENSIDRRAWKAAAQGITRVGYDWVINMYYTMGTLAGLKDF